MKVVVSAREILDDYNWEKFCDITGLDVWAVSEGMYDTETFDLTLEQAQVLGIIEIPQRD
jgi:hypothetical protein